MPSYPRKRWEQSLLAVVLAVALVASSAAVLRAFLLLTQPPDAVDLWLARHPAIGSDADDARYSQHAAITLLHVIPAILFAMLAPLQFAGRIRREWPWLHRWSGRLLVLTGIAIGTSGLVLGFTTALSYAGWSETGPIVVFAPLFLFALTKAVIYIRRREVALHREWMIRAFSLGVSAGTVRVLGFAVALNSAARHTPRMVVPFLFWAAFVLSLAVGEAWIRYTRPATEPASVLVAVAGR